MVIAKKVAKLAVYLLFDLELKIKPDRTNLTIRLKALLR